MTQKQPFEVDKALERIRDVVKPFPKAAMFALADLGYTSAFEQLVSCIISIRTYDEVSLPTSVRLFQQARTPEQMLKLTVLEIDQLIADATFHEAKARQIRDIA